MKQNYLTESILLSTLFAAALASAQTNEPTNLSRLELRPDEPELKYRVGVAYRLGYEIPVKFKKIGAVGLEHDPGPLNGTREKHNYDNGYVLPDSREVPDYATWNWGFGNDSQVRPVGDGSLSLESKSSPGTSHGEDEFQSGFEITFSRQLGKIRRCRWGVEGAFNYQDVSVHDSDTLYGPVTVVTDTYALNGRPPFLPSPPNPPNTPYRGTEMGPGPLIIDSPVDRDVQPFAGGTTITGTRKFDASVFGLRVGPYLEIPLSESLSFTLSGGFAMARVDSDYTFRQSASIAGAGSAVPTGSEGHGEWMPGGYVAGNLSLALSKHWAVSAGAQFMDVGVYKDTVNGQEVTMDLRQAIFLTLGISYSF